MKNYVTYQQSTGMIVMTGVCQDDTAESQYIGYGSGYASMEATADPSTQYVLGGVVTDRPAMGVSIDKTVVTVGETSTISNVPAGTTAIVDGTAVTVNDGSLAITFDMEGTYKVILWCFPRLDWEVDIICS